MRMRITNRDCEIGVVVMGVWSFFIDSSENEVIVIWELDWVLLEIISLCDGVIVITLYKHKENDE